MSEIVILKNKNAAITKVLDEKGNIEKVIIEKPQYTISEYTLDVDDSILKNGKTTEMGIMPLGDVAENEKKQFYKQLLQGQYSEIENIIVLSGAGTSVGIGKDQKGLTMAQLWDGFEKSNKDDLEKLVKDSGYSLTWADGEPKKDLEVLLSLAGMKNIVEKDSLASEIGKVREFIVKKCSLTLNDNAPHKAFLSKLSLRPQKHPRVKLFTLNYDTLFEQAARDEMFTVIDGFTFSTPRFFNGKYFDYDLIETKHIRQEKKESTIPKLFYLFKMHGSINWKEKDGRIEQFEGEIPIHERVMVFPQDRKYENSYEQPYFEMMARLQQALRTENTLLITIGFSYYDKHISSVIIESLRQNPSMNLMVLTFPQIVDSETDLQKALHKATEVQSRVTLVAETFAEFAKEYPENNAHKRQDILEELNESLKQIKQQKKDDTK